MHADIRYCTAMTSQFLPANVERQREVGLWVVSLVSLSLASLSKLRSSPAPGLRSRRSSGLDETLVPSPAPRDPESSKHHQDIVSGCTECFRSAAGAEHLEFPFNTVGLASLPLPRRTPVGRSHI